MITKIRFFMNYHYDQNTMIIFIKKLMILNP